MTIPERLRDPTLRVPPSMYTTICIPVRLLWGITLLLFPTRVITVLSLVVSVLAVLGLAYKRYVNPHSWKHYDRSITVYLIVSFLFVFSLVTTDHNDLRIYAGILIIIDALMGKQSRYEAEVLT